MNSYVALDIEDRWALGILKRVLKRMFKGWYGEQKTAFNMWAFLDEKYNRFHDVILPSDNGTAQIDHVLISIFGIFIIETKNKSGWIFGSRDQDKWTQVLFNEKYQFQNPLKQVYRQKKVLSQFAEVDESLIHTIVYFVGDSNFKTPLPENVLNSGLSSYITSFRDHILSEDQVLSLTNKFKAHLMSSDLTITDHLISLKKRHDSNTVCPKCGVDLVEKMASKGPNQGTYFLGCKNYPNCKFTKNA